MHLHPTVKLTIQILLLLAVWDFMSGLIKLEVPPLDGYSILLEGIRVAPYFLAAMLFLKIPVDYAVKFFDGKHLFWKFSIYGLVSTIVALAPFIYLLTYIPTMISTGQNPITAWYFSGHWFVWTALVFVVIRFGWNNILKGIFAGAFIYATHEGTWFISSAAEFSRWQYSGQPYASAFWGVLRTLMIGYVPVTCAVITGIVGYYLAWRVWSLKREIFIVLPPILWGVVSLVINVPQTLYLGTPTVYYASLLANLTDILSWTIPIVIACWPMHMHIKPESEPTIALAS